VGSYTVVDDEAALAALVERVAPEPVYALDTEFHREKTYWPRLALLQLATRDGVTLVDPLAVDVTALGRLFEGDATAVLHAADQDLEVLRVACGSAPRHIFDTQVAAGFLGMSSPSLASLHDSLLGLRLPKGDRLTDWLRRPLDDRQLDYAASDVDHLLEIYDTEVEQLEARGRLEWVRDECELIVERPRGPRDPSDAWSRIKEVRQLSGRARVVAQELACWREERARQLDQPPRFVLSDLALVGVAQRAPTSIDELRKVRGVDGRMGGELATQILAVVRDTSGTRPRTASDQPRSVEVPKALRPVVPLLAAWVGQLGREMEIDPSLLATRSDIEAFLAKDESSRLARGWRADVLGDPIERLVEGRASLAFERRRGLVIEPRPPA
jgi:ribonuclease D